MIKSDISTIPIVQPHSEYYISKLISGNKKSFLIEKKSLEMAISKTIYCQILSKASRNIAKEEQNCRPISLLLCSVSRITKSGYTDKKN